MRRQRITFLFVAALAAAVTATPGIGAPAWAHAHPDPTRLYWSHFYDLNSATARLEFADSHGRHRHPLTDPPTDAQDIDPQVAPNGRHVLFERDLPDGSTQVRIIGSDGRRDREIPLACGDLCGNQGPTWTPDGRHVVFTRVVGPFDQVNDSARSAVLWRTDLQGRHLTRLSQTGIDGTYEDYRASFSPRGYIVFVRVRNADITSAAYRMDPDGSNVRRITPWTLDADEVSVSPAASGPSRDLIVFETYGHGIPDGKTAAVGTVLAVHRTNPDSMAGILFLTSTTSAPTNNFNPAWSPDGHHVAFVNNPPGEGDIWRMNWDGAGKRNVTHDPTFEFRPAWGLSP